MLRMISLVLLGCSSIALAQVPSSQPAPAEPAAPVQSTPPAELAPVEDVAPEEPKMKKVCRQVEVVGSAIGRSVCTMKPIRSPKPPKA